MKAGRLKMYESGTRDAHALWRSVGLDPVDRLLRRYQVDLEDGTGYTVMIASEPDMVGQYRWHVSVAHNDRLPEWRDLVEICHRLRPKIVFCMALPPEDWWVNLHEFCLHAWEIKDPALEGVWEGATPLGWRPT